MEPITAISGAIKSIIGIFFDSPEVKAVKEEGKIALAKAEIESKLTLKKSEMDAEGTYDSKAQDNMKSSWKDEYLILLHTFPIWGYGVPSQTLHRGLDNIWDKFNTAPYWWWICYIGMIASTFGLRWLFTKDRLNRMTSQ